uniref:Uncharacterized protein n=1 Tax=Vespula pensylvanica TaxID=30213 RepID=A0A834NQJ0_VESPE|nr:hypothetical protein H0235_012293 [Vespula pensylvanica]
MEQFEPIREWPELLNTQPLPQTLYVRIQEESRREAERLYRRHSVREGSRIFHVVDLRARLNNRAMLVGGRAAGVLFGTLFQVHDYWRIRKYLEWSASSREDTTDIENVLSETHSASVDSTVPS